VIRTQSALKQLTGVPVQPARNDRSWVHIQADRRTLTFQWGAIHICGYTGQDPILSATHVHMWRGPSTYPDTNLCNRR
jgi:hypothetical protein